jgi:hypothetical protein
VILETLRSIPYPDTHHDLSRVLTIISRLGEDPGEEELNLIRLNWLCFRWKCFQVRKRWKRRGAPLIVLVWKDTGRSAETSGEPDARGGGPLERRDDAVVGVACIRTTDE